MFKKLIAPGKIRNLDLRNRVILPAIGLNFTTQSFINDTTIGFYEARARGGVALLYLPACIDHSGEQGYERLTSLGKMGHLPSLGDDRFVPGWRQLVDVCHRHGAKVGTQLVHVGKYAHSSALGGVPPASPSAIKANLTICGLPGEVPRALTVEEIRLIVSNFARTVERAIEAGLDTIEFNVGSGYLVREFLSPLCNQRDDEYGGSLENRLRFLLEIVERSRAVAGDFPLTVRLSADEFLPGGYTLDDARVMARRLEEAGIDAISVVGGGHETIVPLTPMSVPPGAFVYLAQAIKAVVRVPVVASARICEPIVAEQILAEERADFVAVARALIADPEWVKKAQEGRPDEITPCVGCNQGCFDRVFRWQPVTCLMNPEVGRERELEVKPAATKKRVMVAGGGPGGLEAAWVLAKRGHSVVLYEKSETLGGNANLAALPPYRGEFHRLGRYFAAELARLGVDVVLGEEATLATVKREEADAVVVATGASPLLPRIPGIEGPHVVNAWDVLEGRAEVGSRVVVIGGGSVGLETAMALAKRGTVDAETAMFLATFKAVDADTAVSLTLKGTRDVTVIELLDKVGRDIGAGNRWVFLRNLKDLGITLVTGMKIEEITRDGVKGVKDGQPHFVPSDTVVVAVGAQPRRTLYDQLQEIGEHGKRCKEVYLIGDAQAPRNILEAIHEGFAVGCLI